MVPAALVGVLAGLGVPDIEIYASVVALAVVAAAVGNFGGGRDIRETLSGFEEVPVISTDASGDFRASISRSGEEISYRLSYADTTGAVTQAHIHLLGAPEKNPSIT